VSLLKHLKPLQGGGPKYFLDSSTLGDQCWPTQCVLSELSTLHFHGLELFSVMLFFQAIGTLQSHEFIYLVNPRLIGQLMG